MPATLIKNIMLLAGATETPHLLRGKEMAELPSILQAYLVIEDDHIASYGPMSALQQDASAFSSVIDASGRIVLPAWCDSHTHLIFPASRETEFVEKIKGASYAEIAAK